MRPSWIRRRWKPLTLVVMLALAIAADPRHAAACSIRVPGWYEVSTTLRAPALPVGISLVEGEFGQISISNATATPLYLITYLIKSQERVEDIGHSFAAGTGPTQKAAGGQAWEWTPPGYAGEPFWTWQPSGDAIELRISEDGIDSAGGTIMRFQNQVGDNRPADAVAPAPEQGKIRLAYGDELIVIPVDIAYALRPGYEPDAIAKTHALCGDPGAGIFVVVDPATGRLATVTPLAATTAPTARPAATATPDAAPDGEEGLPDSAPGAGDNRPLLGAVAGLLVAGALAWRGLRRRA
ncbi:MAG TPA: hypothetical protein VD886_11150 [Herpetosiphonaceae bacterium]|nr:hypothetical protein [Herpetosiphonaceae bacterium]